VTQPTKEDMLPYVCCYVDSAQDIGTDEELRARLKPDYVPANLRLTLDKVRIVGWQCGFEPMCVAVFSFLPGLYIDNDEATTLAVDLLLERGWFADTNKVEPDFIL
jgi:hypothetical protein